MARIYEGAVGVEILINMNMDISEATVHSMLVLKDGTETTWSATVYQSNYLRYVTEDGDLDDTGTYIIHPNITLGGFSGLGDPVSFKVYEKWKHV